MKVQNVDGVDYLVVFFTELKQLSLDKSISKKSYIDKERQFVWLCKDDTDTYLMTKCGVVNRQKPTMKEYAKYQNLIGDIVASIGQLDELPKTLLPYSQRKPKTKKKLSK